MSSKLWTSLLAVAVLACLALPAIAATGKPKTVAPAKLAKLRQAVDRFKDVAVAERAGYVSTKECVFEKGRGGMGVHYLNGALAADGKIDPLKPELLLYAPKKDGSLELVGVEWFKLDSDSDLATADPLPKVYGATFDGPMDHGGTAPVHYDLHMWLYAKNPRGLFAQYNPKVRC
jgi:hypothetical protein